MGNFSYLYSDYNEYPNSKGGIEENDNVALLTKGGKKSPSSASGR